MPSFDPDTRDTAQQAGGVTRLSLLLSGLDEIDRACADRPPVRAMVLRLKDLARHAAPAPPPPATGAAAALSGREREVLRLSAGGHSTKAIAQLLSLGPKSVQTYKERAMDKLALRDRVALVRFAAALGWLS